MNNRFGYKGTESALNGLTLWIENNIKLSGSAEQRYAKCCKLIIDYGEANIPAYKKYGHLVIAAEYIAKKIKKNNKFNDFANFVLNNSK